MKPRKTQKNYSDLTTPSFQRNEWSRLEVKADQESLVVFDELDAISEEIEQYRIQNCRRSYAAA